MVIRSEKSIYQVLEKYLREAKEPVTCTELMQHYDVEVEALNEFGKDKRLATNKLSDALGFMWRRGLLTRYPAPRTETSFARYAYLWDKVTKPEDSRPLPPPTLSTKQGVNITETQNGVEIEFDKFIISVRPK